MVIVGLKSGLNEDIDASRRVDFVCRRTRVANSGWIKLPLPNPPRFQVYNAETLGLEVAPPVDGGVLASDDGTVAALWVSCAYQPAPNQIASVFRGLPTLEAEYVFMSPNQHSRGHVFSRTRPYSAVFTVLFSVVFTRCSEDAAQYRIPAPIQHVGYRSSWSRASPTS